VSASKTISGLAVSATLAAASTAGATFHLMHIEQVMGGVNGDTSAQAVQLRMRTSFQNFVSQARIVAYDASGLNAVLVKDLTTDVANGSGGDRVLIASTNFATSPAVTPDFVMSSLIPASYLAAGSVTFEDDFGNIYARLCWGGSSYTGSTLVLEFNNDDDGNVARPVSGALPSAGLTALRYTGTFSSLTTNNAANYAVTPSAATFTNNAGQSGTVVPPAPACPGDIMDNNNVDVNDLLAVISSWGPCAGCPPTHCAADIAPQPNGDCAIDVNDLLVVITTWGPCQ